MDQWWSTPATGTPRRQWGAAGPRPCGPSGRGQGAPEEDDGWGQTSLQAPGVRQNPHIPNPHPILGVPNLKKRHLPPVATFDDTRVYLSCTRRTLWVVSHVSNSCHCNLNYISRLRFNFIFTLDRTARGIKRRPGNRRIKKKHHHFHTACWNEEIRSAWTRKPLSSPVGRQRGGDILTLPWGHGN